MVMAARRMSVNLDDIAEAMSRADRGEVDYFLDTRAGRVMRVPLEEADGFGDGYARIPEMDAHETYRIMEDFIDTVRDGELRDALEEAIAGHGAFREFAAVLQQYPEQYERWRQFEADRKRGWAREFLKELGIVSTWRPPERSAGHAGQARR